MLPQDMVVILIHQRAFERAIQERFDVAREKLVKLIGSCNQENAAR